MPEIPPGDSKSVWQSQTGGTAPMTLELIHEKARQLRAKTRRQLLGTLSAPVTAGFLYVFAARAFRPFPFVLHALFGAALLWSLGGLYFLNRGMWPATMPGDAGLRTGLEFCRQAVELRKRLLGGVLLWSFGPIVAAIGAFLTGLALMAKGLGGLVPNGLPFLTLLVVWVFGYFAMRLREQRELSRESAELERIARENQP